MRTTLKKSQQDFSEFGLNLVDSISIPEKTLNTLFAALFISSVAVFLGGNLLLLNTSVLLRSAQVALPCFGLLMIFYTLSRFLGSVISGLVLTYGLMWLVTFSRQISLVPVVYMAASISLIYTMRFMRVDRSQWLSVLFMAVISSAAILGTRGCYTSFDILERLITGYVGADPLYNVSISAMIKNYGVVSTGLHGLIHTPYHSFSHVLFAAISLLSGVGVLEVYGGAHWILFAPILVFSLVAFCVMLDRREELNIPIVWGIISALILILTVILSPWVLWNLFLSTSESYLVSLGLFLIGLPILFKTRLSLMDTVLVVILSAMISNSKAPLGVIFCVLLFARLICFGRKQLLIELTMMFLSAITIFYVVFSPAKASSGIITIVPFQFIAGYSFLGSYVLDAGIAMLFGKGILSFNSIFFGIISILSFYFFHFILSWIAFTFLVFKKGTSSIIKEPIAIYSLVVVIIGLLITLCISIPGAGALYFSQVSFFICLPWVSVIFSHWINQQKIIKSQILNLGTLLVIAFGIPGYYQASFLNRRGDEPQNQLIKSLLDLRQNTKTNIVLQLVCPELVQNPVKDLEAQPFIFPAVSERPWIGVVPVLNKNILPGVSKRPWLAVIPKSDRDIVYKDYGYQQYGITNKHPQITMQPQLLPGMKILRWSPVSNMDKYNKQSINP